MRMKWIFVIAFSFILLVSSVSAQASQASYSGVLPTNPLYKLQLAWDKLSLLFAINPTQKMSRYIELANRELGIAEKLVTSGANVDLALRSAFRGEHYITLLVLQMKDVAYRTGSVDKSLIAKAHSANVSHQQQLGMLIQNTTAETQKSLATILEFSQRNDKELSNLEQEYSLTNVRAQ